MQTQRTGRDTAKTAYFRNRANAARAQLERIDADLTRARNMLGQIGPGGSGRTEVETRISHLDKQRREQDRIMRNALVFAK